MILSLSGNRCRRLGTAVFCYCYDVKKGLEKNASTDNQQPGGALYFARLDVQIRIVGKHSNLVENTPWHLDLARDASRIFMVLANPVACPADDSG